MRHYTSYLLDEWWKGTLIFFYGICRTVDGIQISSRMKRARALGLYLVEFMGEADYTGTKKRSEIISLLVTDLLGSTELSQSDLKICHRVGDIIIDSVNTVIDNSKSDYNLSNYFNNYFKILHGVGTYKAINQLWKSAKYLQQLSLTAYLENIRDAVLLITDETGAKFVTEGFTSIAESIKSAKWNDAITFMRFCNVLMDVPPVIKLFDKKKIGDHKLLLNLLESWHQVQFAVAINIQKTSTLDDLGVNILQHAAKVATVMDQGTHSVEIVKLCLSKLVEHLRSIIAKTKENKYKLILTEIESRICDMDFLKHTHPLELENGLKMIIANERIWSWVNVANDGLNH